MHLLHAYVLKSYGGQDWWLMSTRLCLGLGFRVGICNGGRELVGGSGSGGDIEPCVWKRNVYTLKTHQPIFIKIYL